MVGLGTTDVFERAFQVIKFIDNNSRGLPTVGRFLRPHRHILIERPID